MLTYQLDMGYDSIHNITAKNQSDVITQPSGTPVAQKKTSYVFNYAYNPSGANSVRPHAPTQIANLAYSYDANGNQLGWDNLDNGTRRNIVWDEDNRVQSLFDNGHEKTYVYDDAGQRIIKRGPQGETVYVNQYFTIRNKEIGTKHVFAGSSRLVSKLMKQDKPGANPHGQTPLEKDLYFFHPDHLGSSNYITDSQGQMFEHLEYFPFGETWVEESSNTQRTPYLFTGKELDEETNLYYFGARYYDPRTSVWQSPDAILGRYLPAGQAARDLPAGGVYQPMNLGLYSYGHNNPIKYADPDGNIVFIPVIMGALWVADKAYAAYEAHQDLKAIRSGEKTVTEVAKDRAGEYAAGLVLGAVGRGAVKAGKALLRHSDEIVDVAKMCSFSGDTPVMTKEGLKPIEQIKAGDEVLARNDQGGAQDWKRVLLAYSSLHQDALELLIVDEQSGEVIDKLTTTAEHPFYVEGRGWLRADHLKGGERLSTATSGWVRAGKVTWLAGEKRAYNMTVEGFHTYFVGVKGVWVHNVCDRLRQTKGHHPVPKFMGGDPLQWLETALTKTQHTDFHRELAANLKKSGFQLNALNSSKTDWAEYFKANPGAQKIAYGSLLDTARDFDKKHGTDLVTSVWKNVVEGRMNKID